MRAALLLLLLASAPADAAAEVSSTSITQRPAAKQGESNRGKSVAAGDKLKVFFEPRTDSMVAAAEADAVLTKVEVDGFVNFSVPLATNYTGAWALIEDTSLAHIDITIDSTAGMSSENLAAVNALNFSLSCGDELDCTDGVSTSVPKSEYCPSGPTHSTEYCWGKGQPKVPTPHARQKRVAAERPPLRPEPLSSCVPREVPR